MSIRIIACGVFRDALGQIDLQSSHRNVAVTYITPYLHNHPQQLQAEILRQIQVAKRAGEKILFLYGRCYPELDDHLEEMGVSRVPGEHCYEILLGSRRFDELLAAEAGTYFVEKELVLNFDQYCIQPLELDDPVMRNSFFRHYKRLAYIRQPLDPDTVISGVHDISRFLGLTPLMIDADYAELTASLLRLFTEGH